MWIVKYDRHLMNSFYKSSHVETKSKLLALCIYRWWAFCFLMNVMPVKHLSLYRREGEILYIKGERSKSQNLAQLRKIKCKRQ